MSRSPLAWVVCLAAVAVALAGALWWVSAQPVDRAAPPGPVPRPAFTSLQVDAPDRSTPAVDVLHAWDRARARAYAAGDAAALRPLYVDGSRAGTSDARMLRGYTRRGLRIEGMRMQVLEVEVLGHTPRRWRLRVTDRLLGAVAVDRSGTRLPLPRDRASTRTLTFHRTGDTWQVASVR